MWLSCLHLSPLPISQAGGRNVRLWQESPALYYCAKASRAQLPDMPLRSDTQALRLIASIPRIQRREKRHSREEKSTFP